VSIEFPLGKKLITLGEVPDSVITVNVLTVEGFLPFEFILDTGADCTVLPKYMAKLTGVNLSTCRQDHTYGLEERPLKVYIGKITIKISRYQFPIRCLFAESDTTSLLLGRMDIFAHFNITFDNKNERIKLTKI
jgi:hypothetical protein